jgi:predicted ArsR family transcriptional regulator
MPSEDDLGAMIVCRATIVGSSTDTDGRIVDVTAGERPHKLVDELSDQEAHDAVRYIVQRREDPVIAAFRDAPEDDEPFTAADEDALAEVQADRTAGAPRISYTEIMRKHGDS